MNRFTRFLASASFPLALFAFAPAAYAQSAVSSSNGITDLGSWLLAIIAFIDVYVVPLVFAIAFIVFIWGVYSYFIAGGANEEKRDQGKQFIVYGIIGFFLMFSVWGIVNLLVNTFHFNSATRPSLPTFGPANTSSSGNTGAFGNTTAGGTTGSKPSTGTKPATNGNNGCLPGYTDTLDGSGCQPDGSQPTPPTQGDLNGLHQ